MTEQEWVGCADPEKMLEFLRGTASDRKLRLFACACARAVWDLLEDERARHAVEVGERYADGLSTTAELGAASNRAWEAVDACPSEANYSAQSTVEVSTHDAAVDSARHAFQDGMPLKEQCRLLRETFGTPFRPLQVDPAWLAWHGGAIMQLAQTVYNERELPSGHLDAARLAILADMLEEAGATDPHLLGHLRSPGPHVRGCAAVDLLFRMQ
jgi:hypothetical protein